jgi:hypothetical protein
MASLRLHMLVALTCVILIGVLPAAVAAGASSPASGPVCTPASVDGSALLDGAVTVSPMPGAADAAPQTEISLLGVPAADLSAVAVRGSSSGVHSGRREAYSQGDGESFIPAAPFTPGEVVTVSAQLTLAPAAPQPLGYQFTVGEPDQLMPRHESLHPLRSGSLQTFVSRPDLLPPVVTVRTHSPAQAPGDTFLGPYGTSAHAGPMIMDGAGKLVWFNPLPRPLVATNLRVQTLDGAPVLTWWQGTITNYGFGQGVDVIDNEHYRTIAEVRAGNGDQADLHEFQLTPAGTALLTAYRPLDCNLHSVGGPALSAVTDSLFQEIDVRTGLVMFEWTSLDHIPLSDSYSAPSGSSTHWPFDFFHLNSINLDADGTLLVSSRNTWAADEIDPHSGVVLWTLGGKASSFTEGHGAATAYQHDARPAGPGEISFFDNGGSPQVHAQSRGVVLALNQQTHTVSVLEQFLHPGRPLLAESQGDLQSLGHGDWFVGWGQERYISEFGPHSTLLFDATLPPGWESYRALSFDDWNATPTSAPALALRQGSSGVVAYASWNGATGVARWQVLAGASRGSLHRLDTVARSGFETSIALSKSQGGVVEVRALDAHGAVLGTSAAQTLASS